MITVREEDQLRGTTATNLPAPAVLPWTWSPSPRCYRELCPHYRGVTAGKPWSPSPCGSLFSSGLVSVGYVYNADVRSAVDCQVVESFEVDREQIIADAVYCLFFVCSQLAGIGVNSRIGERDMRPQYSLLPAGMPARNETLPKIMINSTVNLFLKLQSAFW